MAGGAVTAKGSETGAEGESQPPVVPPLKLPAGQEVVGPPVTPKYPPVKFGPPWLKSTTPEPLYDAAVALVEFTCTPLGGPPTIFTVVVPPTLRLLAMLGWRTMMGPGPGTISTP